MERPIGMEDAEEAIGRRSLKQEGRPRKDKQEWPIERGLAGLKVASLTQSRKFDRDRR